MKRADAGVEAPGAVSTDTGLKPRIAYHDLAWLQAFEKVKKLPAGTMLGDYEIIYAHDDPPLAWVQVKHRREGKRIVRKGDALIFDLAKASDATLCTTREKT